jgi:hypothetical protein
VRRNPKRGGKDAVDATEQLVDRFENLHGRWQETPLNEHVSPDGTFR